MSPPRVIAGLVAAAHGGQRRKIAAGGGPKFVDRAGHRVAYASAQGHAARRCRGGAPHANQLGAERLDEPDGYAASRLVIDFVNVE
jgi:hypothetical protein